MVDTTAKHCVASLECSTGRVHNSTDPHQPNCVDACAVPRTLQLQDGRPRLDAQVVHATGSALDDETEGAVVLQLVVLQTTMLLHVYSVPNNSKLWNEHVHVTWDTFKMRNMLS